MSKISYTPAGLSDIVKEANLIVEVQCVDSFAEEITVTGDAGSIAPPFVKQGFTFKVLTILKNTTGSKIPETIRVPNEDWRRRLAQHKEQHADGKSKSYHIKEYPTDVASLKEAELLFLHYFQDVYELITKDSYESSEAREKVDILLAAKTRR
jgi:hypothetical protein